MTPFISIPNALGEGGLALVLRAVQHRARTFRTSADAAQRGCLATTRHVDSAEYLTAQATTFTALAAKLEALQAEKGSFTLEELTACREADEVERRRAARLPGQVHMYYRLLDKLAHMASYLGPPLGLPVVHFDVSTQADGMHLPRCGQVDNRGLGPARTGYSTDPGRVTCKKCAGAIAAMSAAAVAAGGLGQPSAGDTVTS